MERSSMRYTRASLRPLSLILIFSQFTTIWAGISLDPVVNFCRRIGHSSVFKNGRLYINGGLETFADLGANGQADWSTITSGINEELILVDMTSSWDWKTNVSIAGLKKTESGSVSGMPWPINTNNGALYGGTSESNTLWSFGGTTSGFNTSFPYFEIPPTTQFGIWTYDLDAATWSATDTSQEITIPSYGASAEAPALGLSFYLGGQIDSGTANEMSSLGNEITHLGGMVALNTISYDVVNVSVPVHVKSNRVGGEMVYVDTFGKAGILALIGGATSEDGLLALDQIAIFDVNSLDFSSPSISNNDQNAWYVQTATGDIPDPRTDFCLVSAPAQDNSSANIYLYGGRSNGTIFDDVYVLSLPSFTWVRVFLGTDARWSMTCHFIPPRQMITIGGGGKSDIITSDCDWETKSLAVLDLSTIGWSSVYDADAPDYAVPSDVIAAIGGVSAGDATKTQPDGGWSTSALSQLFKIQATSASSTTTSSPTSSHTASTSPSNKTNSSLSRGVIAGIAVGGAGGLALLGLLTAMMLRRKHGRSRQLEISAPFMAQKDGLPTPTVPWERAELGHHDKYGDAWTRQDQSMAHEIDGYESGGQRHWECGELE